MPVVGVRLEAVPKVFYFPVIPVKAGQDMVISSFGTASLRAPIIRSGSGSPPQAGLILVDNFIPLSILALCVADVLVCHDKPKLAHEDVRQPRNPG